MSTLRGTGWVDAGWVDAGWVGEDGTGLASGIEPEGDDELACPTATAAAIAIVIEMENKGRRILFMLDLSALLRISETSAQLDAKPPGERCLYSNPRTGGMEKNTARPGGLEVPEGQGLAASTSKLLKHLIMQSVDIQG